MVNGDPSIRQWLLLRRIELCAGGLCLAEALGNDDDARREAAQDLAALEAAGVPLYTTDTAAGGRRWHIVEAPMGERGPPLRLSDVLALCAARQTMDGLRRTAVFEGLASLGDTLDGCLPPPMRALASALGRCLGEGAAEEPEEA